MPETSAISNPSAARGPLGIVAGGGKLPGLVAEAALASGREVFIVSLEGFGEKYLEKYPHIVARFSETSRLLGALRNAGVQDLVLIGIVRRPNGFRYLRDVGPSMLWKAFTNLDLFRGGDSTLLQKIVNALEREGYNVLGAHEVAPELVLPPGEIGAIKPKADAEVEITRGFEAALGLGALDIGQGVVVARRRVLAAEAAEGTDAMLVRVAGLREKAAENGRKLKPMGVLVKCPQPIQDVRVDMPTIGPDTVRGAVKAGLVGIAIAAHRVLVLEPEEVRRLADEAGIFVVARDISVNE